MRILKYASIFIFCLVLIAGGIVFLYSFVPEDKYSESFVIEDPTLQKSLIRELERKDIDFVRDESGQIWFNADDGETVRSVAFKIMREAKGKGQQE